MIWLLIPLGAFLWRLRGGLLNDLTGVANWEGFNDTVVRCCWSVGMALGFAVLGGGWTLHTAALALGLFAGTTLIGWFGALAADTPMRVTLMSVSGLLRMAFVALALFSPWPLVAGWLCGPIYFWGYKLPTWGIKGLVWPEVLFGAAIGAGIAMHVALPV